MRAKMCNKYVVLAILISILLVSCRQKKAVQQTDVQFKSISLDSLLAVNNFSWDYFSGKAEVNVSGETLNQSFNANIKMKKGEFVWLSASMFGIEGGRVYMQNDSVTIINRLNRTYSKIGWQQAGNYIGTEINLQIVQNMLLGNILLERDSTYYFTTDTSFYHVKSKSQQPTYLFNADSAHARIISSYFRGAKTGKYLNLRYSDFKPLGISMLPMLIELDAKDGAQKFIGKIAVQEWNRDEFRVNMAVPSSFKRTQ